MTDETMDLILHGMCYAIITTAGYELENFAKDIPLDEMLCMNAQIWAELRGYLK